MPNAETLAALSQLRQEGKTAEETAETVSSDPRFARVVQADDLRNLFASSETLQFRLVLTRDNPEVPLRYRAGCARILNTALWDNGVAVLTATDYAVQFREGVAALRQFEVLDDDDVAAVLALGGGKLLDPLTAEEVSAVWAQQDRESAAETALGRVLDAVAAKVSALRVQEARANALMGEVRAGLDSGADLESLADELEGG